MRSADLKRAKRAVRRQVLARRDAIPAERRAPMGEEIAERFLALPEVTAASTVMLFWSFGSEVPTAGIVDRLDRRDVVVALPRIEGSDLAPVRETFVRCGRGRSGRGAVRMRPDNRRCSHAGRDRFGG